jgi:hypothetical protein
MREQVAGVSGSGLLMMLGMIVGRLRRGRGPGLWTVARELAHSFGAVWMERAHRKTMVVVLDRVAEGGRIRVIDGAGMHRCYEVEPRPSPRRDDE